MTPGVPSVCAIIPSASFFERELIEMFGITVDGTPNRDRLFLPDDWPQGVYPLRKDFKMEECRSRSCHLRARSSSSRSGRSTRR